MGVEAACASCVCLYRSGEVVICPTGVPPSVRHPWGIRRTGQACTESVGFWSSPALHRTYGAPYGANGCCAVHARSGPFCLHSVRECMHVPMCANACSQGSTQGSKQACGCACGCAGVLACMQDGPPCPPLLMDASIVAANARHGWPEVGAGRGCACMEPERAEEPCMPTPSALPRPSSHGVSPGWSARCSCCGGAWNASVQPKLRRLSVSWICLSVPARQFLSTHPQWERTAPNHAAPNSCSRRPVA